MQREFMPDDAPDPADPDVQFGVAPEQITTELLELCEKSLRQASPRRPQQSCASSSSNTFITAISAGSSMHSWLLHPQPRATGCGRGRVR